MFHMIDYILSAAGGILNNGSLFLKGIIETSTSALKTAEVFYFSPRLLVSSLVWSLSGQIMVIERIN